MVHLIESIKEADDHVSIPKNLDSDVLILAALALPSSALAAGAARAELIAAVERLGDRPP